MVVYKLFAMTLSKEMIEDLVSSLAGGETILLTDLLVDNPGISEFDLADKLEISINEVRNLIYKLQDHNLVYSTRKKDRQKGWYIYYWTFNMIHAKDLLITKKQKEIIKLEEIRDEEIEGKLYACPNRCLRMSLEDAMEHGFKCPECEKILVQEKDEKDIKKIALDIEQLKKDIHELKQLEFKVVDEEDEKKKKVKKVAKKKVVKKKIKKVKKKVKKVKKKVAKKKSKSKPKKKAKKKK